jgi:hypothetical protein
MVIRLAGTARLRDVVVDTSHLLGNAPAQVQIGWLTAAGYDAALRRWLDTLPPAHLRQVLTDAGLDGALVAAVLRARDRPLDWPSEVLAAFTPR